VLRGLSKAKTAEWVGVYAASAQRRDYVDSRAGKSTPREPAPASPGRPAKDGLAQWGTLVRRNLSIKLKDTWNTAILLAQAPIIAALITLVFGPEASGNDSPDDPAGWTTVAGAVSTVLFDLVLAAVWFGCSNSAREIVGERAIYVRERMINLQLVPYLASKFTVLGGLCCLQCLVLLGIVHWGSGLKGPLVPMFLVLLLASCAGLAVGLLVSSVAKTAEVAIALVPLVILPMLILGGAMQPIHKMNAVMKPLAFLMPSRWAYEGLLVLEAGARPKLEPSGPFGRITLGKKPDAPDMAEKSFPAESGRSGVAAAIFMLATMCGLLFAANRAVLKSKDINKSK
jgi:hypothetical protein